MGLNKKRSRRALYHEDTAPNANFLRVLSMMKLQNMSGGKAKFWRRRAGSSRISLMSNQSAESKTVSKLLSVFFCTNVLPRLLSCKLKNVNSVLINKRRTVFEIIGELA